MDDAYFYESNYRPIPIQEYLVFDNMIYPASDSSGFIKPTSGSDSLRQTQQRPPRPRRSIQRSQHNDLSLPLVNAVVSLANEAARAGHGTLIFSSSRAGCERDALLVSRVLPSPEEVGKEAMEKRLDLMRELAATSTGLDHVLESTVPLGVAFHRKYFSTGAIRLLADSTDAGMTVEERELVSLAFETGTIKIIVATCTLAAGLNLPARRVILHGARMGSDIVGPAML